MPTSIRTSLQITSGNLTYQSQPQAFTPDDAPVMFGPTPGAVLIQPNGTIIDLSQLVQPGLCRIMNIDPTNYVTKGVYDQDNSTFYPSEEYLPGESFILRISRQLGEKEAPGTGTGAANTLPTVMMLKANLLPTFVLIEAFESADA